MLAPLLFIFAVIEALLFVVALWVAVAQSSAEKATPFWRGITYVFVATIVSFYLFLLFLRGVMLPMRLDDPLLVEVARIFVSTSPLLILPLAAALVLYVERYRRGKARK